MSIDINTASIIKEPNSNSNGFGATGSDVILHIAAQSDGILPWGQGVRERDRQLREFWPTEPLLASAVFNTAARYVAFGWTINGPERTAAAVRRILHSSEFGQGWTKLMMKVLIDLFTQDNGSFIEIVRDGNEPTSPVVSLNHLDSNQCYRTGRRREPVIYTDSDGKRHILKWYEVIVLSEFPSPIERYHGVQYCAVTRLLRAAQVLKDISIYRHEKISGQFQRGIYFVSGIQSRVVEDQMALKKQLAANYNLQRFIEPVIIGALDPGAKVEVSKIDFASLPDHFDEETTMKWYIAQLALAFGSDYQDYAPLPGGNLGTSQQSATLHLKSRSKGPALFMSMVEHVFNFHGVMPQIVRFKFGDQDVAEDMAHAELRKLRAEERAVRIASGEITIEMARQIAADHGDLNQEYLEILNEPDLTPDVKLSGSGADNEAKI